MDARIKFFVRPNFLAFARESRTPPGEGTILVAEGDGRYWWIYDPFAVDGVEWFHPQPDHRCVQPLTIRVSEKSADYDTRQHRLQRLSSRPTVLLAALEQVKQRQQPRTIKRSLWPVFLWWVKRRSWLFWRGRRTWFHK